VPYAGAKSKKRGEYSGVVGLVRATKNAVSPLLKSANPLGTDMKSSTPSKRTAGKPLLDVTRSGWDDEDDWDASLWCMLWSAHVLTAPEESAVTPTSARNQSRSDGSAAPASAGAHASLTPPTSLACPASPT
jgi:hypothetical protein